MPGKRSVPSRKADNTKNRFNADYSAHWTATNSNTTAVNAVNTGSGGTTRENFLGGLTVLANQGSISTTGVGTISGSGAVNNITNAEFNSVNTQLNSLISSYNALLAHLQANGFMT